MLAEAEGRGFREKTMSRDSAGGGWGRGQGASAWEGKRVDRAGAGGWFSDTSQRHLVPSQNACGSQAVYRNRRSKPRAGQ